MTHAPAHPLPYLTLSAWAAQNGTDSAAARYAARTGRLTGAVRLPNGSIMARPDSTIVRKAAHPSPIEPEDAPWPEGVIDLLGWAQRYGYTPEQAGRIVTLDPDIVIAYLGFILVHDRPTTVDRSLVEFSALDLHRSGLTFPEIGKRFGVTKQRAFQLVQREKRLEEQRTKYAEPVA